MGNLINLGNIFSGTDSKTVNDEFKVTIDRDDLFAIKKSIQFQSELLRDKHGMNLTICNILNGYLKRKSYLLTDRDEYFYLNNLWLNFDRNMKLVEKINSAVMQESDWTKRENHEGTWFNLLQNLQKTKREWCQPTKSGGEYTYYEIAIFNMKKREKFDERLQLKLIQAEEKNEGEKK